MTKRLTHGRRRLARLSNLLRLSLGGFALTLTLAATAGAAGPGESAPRQFTLSNGMTLIVKPDHRAPTAVHMLWVRVGAMDEVDGTTGVAHALEHMMFKGSPSLPPGEFSRRVAALGGSENAFTSRDATAYHQQVPVEHLEAVMRLEADRFENNRWDDDEFRREIEVIKEERRQRTEESPRARMFEQMSATVFVASPYRRPIIGWMSDIEAMTPDDVREFHRRWYVPANAAVVIAGDVEVDRVHALAEAIYGRIPARPVPPRKPRTEPEQQGPKRLDYHAAAEQSLVALAWHMPKLADVAGPDPDGTDALALTLLAAVLDGYPGARLERSLVQGGGADGSRIADSAGASYGLMSRGPQVFTLTAVPAPGVAPEAAAAALRAEIARIAQDGVGEAELRRVLTQWTVGEVYKLDSVFNQARELGSHWINGAGLDTSERLLQRLREVTPAQIQSVARRLFGDERLTTAVLVPDAAKRAAVSGRQPAPALTRH